MFNPQWKYLFHCLFLCCALPSSLSCQADKQSRMIELIKSKDVRIDFYGKVQDQQGHPVEGADVLLHLKNYNPFVEFYTEIKEIHVKTDTQGYFSIFKKTGSHIFIQQIQKIGYEYSWPQEKNSFQYSGDGDIPFVPDPNHPILFRMRKMGEATFLLKSGTEFEFLARESGTEQGYDLIKGIGLKAQVFKSLLLNDEPVFPDLKVKAAFDEKSQTWSVTIFAGTSGGGILASDQLLYEAPSEGYQSRYDFSVHIPVDYSMPEKSKYLYYRSREPAIYSRLEIQDIRNVTKDHIDFGGKGVTNPYGDRNLERATDLPGEVEFKLDQGVRASFRQNRRPLKPDLPKLIQEAEQKKPLLQRLFKK